MSGPVRIGTRGSPLALAQAAWVRDALARRHPGRGAHLVVIRTSGDRFADRPLAAIGGKGLFVKEIDEALLAGRIDCAVHSAKDLPAELAPGVVLAAVPPRADPRDVLLTAAGEPLDALGPAARVGTSSLRRAALLRHLRPDLRIAPLRGNVDSRLRRLAAGVFDALVVAAAGLERLGLRPPGARPLDPAVFVPAIGQGALALTTRAGDAALLAWLDDAPSRTAVTAERAFMRAVGGSCHTPLAAHATTRGDALHLRALIAMPDGSAVVAGEASGTAEGADALGHALAARLLASGGAGVLDAVRATADPAGTSPPSDDAG